MQSLQSLKASYSLQSSQHQHFFRAASIAQCGGKVTSNTDDPARHWITQTMFHCSSLSISGHTMSSLPSGVTSLTRGSICRPTNTHRGTEEHNTLMPSIRLADQPFECVFPWCGTSTRTGISDVRDSPPSGRSSNNPAREFLGRYQLESTIITNVLYEDEMKQQARESGMACEFLVA